MLQCFLADLVELHVHPPHFAPDAGERPVASPVARLQATAGERVTNLRHYPVELDEFGRLLLPYLDGSRDRAALVALLADLVARGVVAVPDKGAATPGSVPREYLEQALAASLHRLAASALLLG
jgi:hypothetical protein